jgi:hypothetical protein
MERIKKLIRFLIGLAIIPAITTYFTVFILKIDIFERLYNSLFFDYVFAYILTPLLYRPKIQKYIPNKYIFFSLIFFLFWLWELFRITFI